MVCITYGNIIGKQIHFLTQLSTIPKSKIKVMLTPQTAWIPFSHILAKPPERPVHSRSILKNELVIEIDSDDWTEVRDGTRRMLHILNEWGADGSYYLSFSGNRSIHVHVFLNTSSLTVREDVIPLLQGHDDVIPSVKSYLTLQIARASAATVDMQLTGIHLIRMEGGFNEKSGKYCTMIKDAPDEKPLYYDVVVPAQLPHEFWNLNRFENEINSFLKVHYSMQPKSVYRNSGRKIDPEPLKEILKPVYIKGYRHWIVLSLSGWLKRHSVPEIKALEIVRTLNPNDRTPSKTAATVRNVYRAHEDDRIPGLPKLLSIITQQEADGKIPGITAEGIRKALVGLNHGDEKKHGGSKDGNHGNHNTDIEKRCMVNEKTFIEAERKASESKLPRLPTHELVSVDESQKTINESRELKDGETKNNKNTTTPFQFVRPVRPDSPDVIVEVDKSDVQNEKTLFDHSLWERDTKKALFKFVQSEHRSLKPKAIHDMIPDHKIGITEIHDLCEELTHEGSFIKNGDYSYSINPDNTGLSGNVVEGISEEEGQQLINSLIEEGIPVRVNDSGKSYDDRSFKIAVEKSYYSKHKEAVNAKMAEHGFTRSNRGEFDSIFFFQPLKGASSQ